MNKLQSLAIICILVLCGSECYANNTLTMYATDVGLYHLDIKNRETIYNNQGVELVRCVQAERDCVIIVFDGIYQFERHRITGKYTITLVKSKRPNNKVKRYGFIHDVNKDFFSNFNVKVVK